MLNFRKWFYVFLVGVVPLVIAGLLPASSIVTNFFTLKAPGTIQTVDNILVNSASPGFGVSQAGVTRGTIFANAAGTLFEYGRYSDLGVYLDDYVTFTRATGDAEFPHNVKIDGTCTGCGGGGSVINVATNFPLGGGPITTTGTLTCATCTVTVASGTLALNTTTVNTGTCGTAQTATATGTASTDAIALTFNADPTGVTGYAPSTNGMLTIIPYPTTNTVNVKVCNNTSANITPGGTVTLNFRVTR
jgi:hypothetical protein